VALVLTLLLTPVAYSIVEDISEIRLCARLAFWRHEESVKAFGSERRVRAAGVAARAETRQGSAVGLKG
jgi:hypothetical protein